MTPDQIVRAWKDADYGATLPLEQASMVPAHPVGVIEIPDDALGQAAGGEVANTEFLESLGCCQGITQKGYCDLTAGPNGHCTWFCFSFFWTSDAFC